MKIFSTILLLLLAACSASKRESPVVYFSNASEKPIRNIKVQWVSANLSLPSLNPGDTRSQSFYITKDTQFLGLIRASWVNGEGNSIVKEFRVNAKNLPSISDRTTYSYVQLYLDQYDLEVVTSDAADLPGKTRRMEQVMAHYRDHFTKGTPIPAATSLIRVEPRRDTSVPQWLERSIAGGGDG
jgi:hypothetical protein